MQQYFEHFYSVSCHVFFDEVDITFKDKTNPNASTRRDHYWRHTLKTMTPEKLKIEMTEFIWVSKLMLFITNACIRTSTTALYLDVLVIKSAKKANILNNKYNCSGPPTIKSQKVGYQSNQKLLHHYKHSKNQLNS